MTSSHAFFISRRLVCVCVCVWPVFTDLMKVLRQPSAMHFRQRFACTERAMTPISTMTDQNRDRCVPAARSGFDTKSQCTNKKSTRQKFERKSSSERNIVVWPVTNWIGAPTNHESGGTSVWLEHETGTLSFLSNFVVHLLRNQQKRQANLNKEINRRLWRNVDKFRPEFRANEWISMKPYDLCNFSNDQLADLLNIVERRHTTKFNRKAN